MPQGQWRCANSPYGDLGHVFPDFGESSEPDPSLWQDSMFGVSFVYPISSSQINCSGIVTGIEFCYRTPLMDNQANLLIFTLLILKQSSGYFNVTKFIPVNSTSLNITSLNSSFEMDSQQTDIKCRYSDTELYCCDIVMLSEEDKFQFPAEDFAIGITTPNSAVAVLQKFQEGSDLQMYSVPFYIANMPLMDGNTYNFMDAMVSNATFHVVRLHISKSKSDKTFSKSCTL